MKHFILIKILFLLISINALAQDNKLTPNNVTIEQKISQMIVIGYNNKDELKEILNYAKDDKISGVIFYKRNIKSPLDISLQIKRLKKATSSNYPLFLMIDQEGGLVSRLNKDNGFKYYIDAQKVGKDLNKDEASALYNDMAKSLFNVGFNFNLAPCVDLHKHENSFIANNKRSYGKDAATVIKYATTFIENHNKNNVITTLKHYPGLGSASLDSHTDIVDLTNTWEEDENIPYKEILKKYPFQPVLIGHAIHKRKDSENITSLSSKIITTLSKENNHKGIVIMDAADMGGVQNNSAKDIIIKGINAGVNIFLYPNHLVNKDNENIYITPDRFRKIILQAIKDKQIKKEKIDFSYDKIISLKNRIKLNEVNQ